MKNPIKTPKNFYCEKCDFLSGNKKDYNRHILTRKHKMDNKDKERITKKTQHQCIVCGKRYKYASGLSKHKKNALPFQKKKKKRMQLIFHLKIKKSLTPKRSR